MKQMNGNQRTTIVEHNEKKNMSEHSPLLQQESDNNNNNNRKKKQESGINDNDGSDNDADERSSSSCRRCPSALDELGAAICYWIKRPLDIARLLVNDPSLSYSAADPLRRPGFGWRIIVMMTVMFTLVKGFANIVQSNAQLPFFQNSGNISAIAFQVLTNTATLGWSCQPIIAVLADFVPFTTFFCCFWCSSSSSSLSRMKAILAKHSRSAYCVFYSLLGCASMIGLGLLPQQQQLTFAQSKLAAVLFLGATLAVAALSVIHQGRYSKLMVGRGELGVSLVSYVNVVYYLGTTAGSVMSGQLAEQRNLAPLFWSTAAAFACLLVPLFLGYLEVPARAGGGGGAVLLPPPPPLATMDGDGVPQQQQQKQQPVTGSSSPVMGSAVSSGLGADAPVSAPALSSDATPSGSPVRSTPKVVRIAALTVTSSSAAGVDGAPAAAAAYDEPPTCCNAARRLLGDPVRRGAVIVSIILFAVATALVAVQTWVLSIATQFYIALGLCAVAMSSLWFIPHQVLSRAFAFIMIKNSLWFSIGSIMSYYYTMPSPCVPAPAPSFDYTFYQTIAGTIAVVVPIAGTVIFQAAFASGTFRRVIIVTTIIKSSTSIFDIMLVNRWNHKINFSDKAMYLFGDASLQPLLYMFSYLPQTLLMSRISAGVGANAVLFGVVAGFESIGQNFAAMAGSYIAQLLNINSQPGECNWDNLTWLIIICHIFSPLAVLGFVFLLPDTRIDEDISDAVSSCRPSSVGSSDDDDDDDDDKDDSKHDGGDDDDGDDLRTADGEHGQEKERSQHDASHSANDDEKVW